MLETVSRLSRIGVFFLRPDSYDVDTIKMVLSSRTWISMRICHVCRVSSLIETLPDDSERGATMWEVSKSHARHIYLIHMSLSFFLRICRISGTLCPLFLCSPSSNGKSGAHHTSTRSETQLGALCPTQLKQDVFHSQTLKRNLIACTVKKIYKVT